MKKRDDIRILLLQFRLAPEMREQELSCFLEFGSLAPNQITAKYLFEDEVSPEDLKKYDALILGGTGDFEVEEIAHKYPAQYANLVEIAKRARKLDMPTLSVCLQIWSKIFGGEVGTAEHQELGSLNIYLTEEGQKDPLFSGLKNTFKAMVGHKDFVSKLPEGAVLLATSDHCPVHAYRIGDKEYFLQFHLELNRQKIIERIEFYKDRYANVSDEQYKQLIDAIEETPFSVTLFEKFLEKIVLPEASKKRQKELQTVWTGQFKGI